MTNALDRPARAFGRASRCTRTALLVLPALFVAACATDAPTTAVAAPTTAPIAYTTLGVDIVATGGYQIVAIADHAEAGLSGTASQNYAVEPFGDVWPNLIRPEYHVRALAAGHGDFSIATTHGIAQGSIESADVARIALVRGEQAGELEVQLMDDHGRMLVDGSLHIDGGTQTAWNRVTVAAGTTLTVSADSIAPVTFAVGDATQIR